MNAVLAIGPTEVYYEAPGQKDGSKYITPPASLLLEIPLTTSDATVKVLKEAKKELLKIKEQLKNEI